MSKIQAFCCSYTVQGSCLIRTTDGTDNADITIAEGVYWTDPVYGSGVESSTGPCILGVFAALLEATAVGGNIGKNYSIATNPFVHSRAMWIDDASIAQTLGSHANTTTEGKRALRRLGLPPHSTGDQFENALSTHGITQGVYYANQGEYGSLQESEARQTVVQKSTSGVAYALAVGGYQRERLIKFSGLTERLVFSNGQIESAILSPTNSDYSMQTLLWEPLKLGEMVRVYDDYTATKTYLTAAMTAAATTAAVASGAGISNGNLICIDGEWMSVLSGGGTTTLTVYRYLPVAHSNYAPVSKDFVATYVLDMEMFDPPKRAHNQPRYDVDIPLVRTVF